MDFAIGNNGSRDGRLDGMLLGQGCGQSQSSSPSTRRVAFGFILVPHDNPHLSGLSPVFGSEVMLLGFKLQPMHVYFFLPVSTPLRQSFTRVEI